MTFKIVQRTYNNVHRVDTTPQHPGNMVLSYPLGACNSFDGMSGLLNFRLGSFDLKLEVIVPFLRVKIDFRATNPSPSLLISLKISNQNLEMAICLIVFQVSGNYVFLEDTPTPQLSGQGL